MAEVWTRNIDVARIEMIKAQALRFYVFPAGLLVLIGLIFGGLMGLLGTAIFVGCIGVLYGMFVLTRLQGLRAVPHMRVDNATLIAGKRSVALNDVVAYTAFWAAGQASGSGMSSPMKGVARFYLERPKPDGGNTPDEIEIVIPLLAQNEFASVEEALAQLLPDRQVSQDAYGEMVRTRLSAS